jgi:hypothetical protein
MDPGRPAIGLSLSSHKASTQRSKRIGHVGLFCKSLSSGMKTIFLQPWEYMNLRKKNCALNG